MNVGKGSQLREAELCLLTKLSPRETSALKYCPRKRDRPDELGPVKARLPKKSSLLELGALHEHAAIKVRPVKELERPNLQPSKPRRLALRQKATHGSARARSDTNCTPAAVTCRRVGTTSVSGCGDS